VPVSVLVVDDSSFFRRRISEILAMDQTFKVVGQAANGQEAIDLALKLKPDLITMDYEMPFLDGISAVRAIMQQQPTSILMFSSLTYEGARTTLDALEAGAKDFLAKSFESVSSSNEPSQNELLIRLRAIVKRSSAGLLMPSVSKTNEPVTAIPQVTASKAPLKPVAKPLAASVRIQAPATNLSTPAVAKLRSKTLSLRPKLCVIGASTGGPMALQSVLKLLPACLPFPIVVAQHMPGTFTKAFADRLNALCQVRVQHAANNDRLQAGCVYIAPGGMQTIIKDGSLTLSILKGDDRLTYKPCIDVTFASAAKACPGKVLALVLTGMGADGADGARLLKQSHSEVWIQDEQSCVVFGMPQAVMRSGCYDDVLSIDRVGSRLMEVANSGCT